MWHTHVGRTPETGFLHRHPSTERMMGVDSEQHVIVDREDWERAREIIRQRPQLINNSPVTIEEIKGKQSDIDKAINSLEKKLKTNTILLIIKSILLLSASILFIFILLNENLIKSLI